MRLLILALIVFLSSSALAQVCPGPGNCVPTEPTGPAELCLPEGCQPVRYAWFGNLVVAESALPNGYAVMGWSGPCLELTRAQCPDIANQAFADLRTAALRAHRAQRYE